jgi:4-amino-4-deoxy-L-arabinose transferase-like glycosyltransferase
MQSVRNAILHLWENKPLTVIIWLAVILRLIAVIFAKGWGMLDDHFLVIEIAQSWVDGGNFNHWLPWSPDNTGPTGHTFFYAGIHFLIFTLFQLIGINDPQFKMLLIRLLHAAFSMIGVILGYKISEKLSGKNAAKFVGLLLAALWFMPWISVRNLVEVVAIPFLFISVWALVKHEKPHSWKILLWAGFIAGVAFSVRYQTILFSGVIGLVLLLQKQIKGGIIYGIGYFLAVFVFQGLPDFFIWGTPFAEFAEYTRYNVEYRFDYLTGEWYNYLLVIAGLLIPPFSLLLFRGFVYKWRQHLIIFLPTFIFLAFHSYFPNKQERFILTIVPFFILLGTIGWYELSSKNSFLIRQAKVLRYVYGLFIVINLVLLAGVSTMYSKRAQVEAMSYLSRYDNIESILVENSDRKNMMLMPQFYLGQWVNFYGVTSEKPAENLLNPANRPTPEPAFLLFVREDNLEKRVADLKAIYPQINYETTIQPGFVDKLLHQINPYNKNEVIIIYRNQAVSLKR